MVWDWMVVWLFLPFAEGGGAGEREHALEEGERRDELQNPDLQSGWVSCFRVTRSHTQSIWRKEHEERKDVWLAWRAGLVLFDAQEGLCAEVGRERQQLHWISVEECDTAALPAQLKADHCIKPIHMRECYLKPEVWSQYTLFVKCRFNEFVPHLFSSVLFCCRGCLNCSKRYLKECYECRDCFDKCL